MKHTLLALLTLLLLLPAGRIAAQDPGEVSATPAGPIPFGQPIETALTRAGSANIDLRNLPRVAPKKKERPELEDPEINPIALPGGPQISTPATPTVPPGPSVPAPATTLNFDGLDFATWGAGHPPDPVGDVGPAYFIQAINTSIGVYRKTDGVRVAAFTFDTFMSQGNFGNLCDTDNFGDPVVLYDTFEDRWVITDFAFQLSGSNVLNPPGAFQCFAVSKTGDPVSGGWNFYSLHITDALNDYPKFGIWPDGIYMSANLFNFVGGTFVNPRVWALNKAQMYAGSPTVQVVSFNAPSADFAVLPSNARLQTGTPPPGTPNYFVSTWQFLNALSVYKFHVDWNSISLSTFTGPDSPLAATSWPNANVANAPSLGGNTLDVLQIRAMMQIQYTNIGGAESLWATHTVRRGDTTGFAAPRWYQADVTGGTVAANLVQATTWDPDGANVIYRFMPSLALDRAGDMAMGYSTSNSTTKPAIKYAGRLATDPVNTLSLTEQQLIQGTGTQTGNCGASACIRWGDYSAMSLDPNGCSFWYTNEYYAVDGLNFLTRIGTFTFPSCTPVGAGGTVSGTVTATVGGAPIIGATLTLGARTATTSGSGFYSFTGLPAGTYPSLTASAPGYTSSTVTNVVVTDGNTTTDNFSLGTAATSACPTDTTQADFLTGVATNLDLATSPGNVTLSNAPTIDQQNTAGTTTGTSFGTASWGGQTFIPAVTGTLVKVDVQLFCSGCTGTTPNLTLSIRNTSGGLPTGADLATATIPGFSNGAGVYYTGSFGSPPTLTSGTQYALILRPVATPTAGGYFWIRSSPSTYANGQRVISTDNGVTWTADSTRDFNFKAYMQTGFAASGDLISSAKDSNPPVGFVPAWTTLSWTATTPTNTTLRFQAAGSNSPYGPFNFVGPDTTAATFFTTSGASLSQFNGFRYLKYRAYLQTTDGTVTPTLSDVTVCFTVVPPDLSLTKSDGGASVSPGGTVAYTLTYANAGGQNATGVVLTETVPANSVFNSGASTAGWVCTPNNNAGSTCTLAVGTVVAGGGNQTATFAVTVVNPVAAGVTQISNTASIADDGTHGTDPTPGNNSGSDTTPVTGAPDLSLTKSDGGVSVAPGGTVAYTLTYANSGNRGATGVVITETVPANSTFNAGASTAGWSCTPNNNAGSTCTLAIGALAAGGGNQTATFAVTAVNPVPGGVTQLSNTASIADDGTNGTDPTPGNNTGSDTTPISGAPDLSITKDDGGVTVVPGGSVTYTLTYSNTGSIGATGVVITETVPANTTFIPGSSTAGWSCTPDNTAGSTCTLSIGALTAGSGNHTATFTVTVANPLSASVTQISNTTTIADDGTNGTDPTPGNNTGSDTTPVLNGLFYAITPCRLLDTRNPNGPYGGPALAALSARVFVAAGQCGIPADAKALSYNVAVTLGTAQGDLRFYPNGGTTPLVAVINYLANQTRTNNGIVVLGAAGDFVIKSDQPTGSVQVIIDLNGYFK